MTKIYVITPWDSEKGYHDRYHNRLKKLTPNCSGKWEDLEICDNFNDADFYIALWCGDPVLRKKCPPRSVINIMDEPSWHIPKASELGEETIASRWVTENHNPVVWSVGKTYSELAKSHFPDKSKTVSSITSGKYLSKVRQYTLYFLKGFDRTFPGVLGLFGKQNASGWVIPVGYRYRIDFIKRFTSTYPGVLDFYGRNVGARYRRFDLSTIDGYLGPVKVKWEGLAPYRYFFAFENVSEKNYFGEKLIDSILAGCMPIYWGCTNPREFFPENSFVELDITKGDAVDKAMDIIRSGYREQNLDALKRAKDLILNKYQFWPTIHRIIKEL